MNLRPLTLIVLTLGIAAGCRETKTVDCLETPADPACIESCMNFPDQVFCMDGFMPPDMSGGDMDMDMPPADGGPCGMCASGTVCDSDSGACVDCLGDGDCDGERCLVDDADPTTNACVACLGDGDCGDERCDTDSNECVACLEDADCPDPAAGKCDTGTNTCVPCDDSEQCTEAGAAVCDAGTCVECSADDETACGTNVCDVAAQSCTSTPANMTDVCQPCVSDRQCQMGKVCVPMEFDGSDVGNFCLWRLDAPAGPAGTCTNVRPYGGSVEVTSVSGTSQTVCTLRSTTCAALEDFDSVTCDLPGTAVDPDPMDECGIVGQDDGICAMRDAVVNLCTIPCLSNFDCKSGSTCTGSPSSCSF